MRTQTSSVIAAVLPPVILLAAVCRGTNESTASKSAAAFDAEQRKGAAPIPADARAGDAHEHGGGGGPRESARTMDHGAHTAGGGTGTRTDHSGMQGMDHSRMPGTATPSRNAPGSTPRAGMDHAAMGHGTGSSKSGADHASTAGSGTTTPSSSTSAHPAQTAGEDHSHLTMALPQRAPIPERAAAVAAPGQPAETLKPDAIDAPAPTSVRDAARSAEMAQSMADGDHGMAHGTYRQIDAGRDEGATHAGHRKSSAARPTPTPTPRPKEDNR